MVGIYKITNINNGKSYIGQSNNIEYRLLQHRRELNNKHHYNKYLQRAWDKYGGNSFTFEVVEECSLEELDLKEVYWIAYYKSATIGYNMAYGGRNGSNLNEEAKIKISNTLKGHIVSESTRNKIREKRKHQVNTRKGVKCTEEQRQRISEAHKGIELSEEAKKKVSENNARYWLGKKRDPEMVAKMAEKLRGREVTQEWKSQLDKAREKKRSISDIHKDKIPIIQEMLALGMKQTKIALDLNIHYSTVRNIIRECIRKAP